MKNPAETWQVQRRSRIELDVVLPRTALAGSSSLAMLEASGGLAIPSCSRAVDTRQAQRTAPWQLKQQTVYCWF